MLREWVDESNRHHNSVESVWWFTLLLHQIPPVENPSLDPHLAKINLLQLLFQEQPLECIRCIVFSKISDFFTCMFKSSETYEALLALYQVQPIRVLLLLVSHHLDQIHSQCPASNRMYLAVNLVTRALSLPVRSRNERLNGNDKYEQRCECCLPCRFVFPISANWSSQWILINDYLQNHVYFQLHSKWIAALLWCVFFSFIFVIILHVICKQVKILANCNQLLEISKLTKYQLRIHAYDFWRCLVFWSRHFLTKSFSFSKEYLRVDLFSQIL